MTHCTALVRWGGQGRSVAVNGAWLLFRSAGTRGDGCCCTDTVRRVKFAVVSTRCLPSCPVHQVLYHHIDEEENKFWPQFEALPGVDADLLSHLGKKFENAKGHAVTR